MSNSVERSGLMSRLGELLQRHRVVAIIGARQVGKTTLARAYADLLGESVHFFDLENPEDAARLADPMLALKNLEGLVVVDEIQRHPDLFPILRVLVDRKPLPARFLILGSASPALLKQSSESLAGRIYYEEMDGFCLEEVGSSQAEKLWLRGGMPESFLSETEAGSFEYRLGYVRTFLEQDLPQLGVSVNATTMRRFWTMLAHYHGQVWNASEFSRSFGVADTTVRTYLDHLSAALVVWQLQPWHENLSKRQVKAPKAFIEDSGVLHALLNLPGLEDVESHPKLGASWEGYVLKQLIHALQVRREECFHWATYSGAEIDLLVVRGRRRLGFEVKRTSAPKFTRSMRSGLEDLKLEKLYVIHAGEQVFDLDERVRAVPLEKVLEELDPLG